MSKFGTVDISGAVELTQKIINADVLMMSQLGYLQANLAMQNIDNIDNASYQGNIKLETFDLGTLLSQNDIGKTTLDLDVNGKGFISSESYDRTSSLMTLMKALLVVCRKSPRK